MANEFKSMLEIEKRKNEADFFDRFKRLEQKSRLNDAYPNVNNLIKLDLKSQLIENIYGIPKRKEIIKNKPITGPNGELAGFEEIKTYEDLGENETPASIKLCQSIYETIKLQKMEYSISIDGAGRKEYVNTLLEPKQLSEEEEKTQTILDKISDKLS